MIISLIICMDYRAEYEASEYSDIYWSVPYHFGEEKFYRSDRGRLRGGDTQPNSVKLYAKLSVNYTATRGLIFRVGPIALSRYKHNRADGGVHEAIADIRGNG